MVVPMLMGRSGFFLLDRPNVPCNIVVCEEHVTHIRKASKNYDYLDVFSETFSMSTPFTIGG